MSFQSKHPYIIIAIAILSLGGTICLFTIPDREEQKVSIIHEAAKDPGKLYPQELFFLDRNYPDFTVPEDLFQQRLAQAIRFDETHPVSRGLDFPWTIQGPGNLGGRVNAIAIHPLDSNNILLGYSQGGMYQTKDGGETWLPVFDEHPSLAISHISFDPHQPNVVYATTGDVNISGYPFLGSGVYRSDDGGTTWNERGLDGTGVLSKVVVDPFDTAILYVGSMGYPSHRGITKGLFRSLNHGQSWQKTLTINDSTGVIDIVADPTKPGRIFATGWTRLRTNTYSTTQGPGTSLYRSDDYGDSWVNVQNGLPDNFHSRTSIEIANDGVLYISYIGTPVGVPCEGYTESLMGVFRSIDAGVTWDTVRAFPENGLPCELFGSFGWYFEAIKVNPRNSNDLFLLGVDIYRSVDGGLSWFPFAPPWWFYAVHADKHDLVFTGDEMYLGTDGGAYKGYENGLPDDWTKIENIPSTQFYKVGFNPHQPDQYFGGAQDNGTTGGNAVFINEWPRIWGGDGFQPLFDPDEPRWMYALTQYGGIWFSQDSANFFDLLTEGIHGTSYWDMPFVMSPHDSKTLFAATHVVYKINMNDSDRVWMPISPDLTKGDTILGSRYPAITAIAQSALDSMRLYAGTQDGKLWSSPDGGTNWIDLSAGTPDHFVTSITTSIINPLGVFVTYSGYRNNDHTPYIHRSDDAGESWTALGADIPLLGVNSFMILPGWNDAVLFAATDGGVYVSLDAGILWERLGSHFPYMPVYDLDYNPVENTIIAGTFSRGILTFPVEELDLINAVDPLSSEQSLRDIHIYPTIVKDHFTLDFEKYSGTHQNFIMTVVNINGHIMKKNKINLSENNKVNININSGMYPGVYFVILSLNSTSIQRKIIINP
jgi:photosystem II stability/assembly factor-like uncharacterized protein